MKSINGSPFVLLLITSLIVYSCSTAPDLKPEPWISQPISEWPDMALANEISFRDTTFTNLANGFLVAHKQDTFAVSCKHIFMVFRNRLGYKKISLGEDFISWAMYPENKPNKRVEMVELINDDPSENISDFNVIKNKDWIVFRIRNIPKDIHVFKIRDSNPRTGEIIYSIGWGDEGQNPDQAALIKMETFRSAGHHYYTKTLSQNVTGTGRSGSAVIDKNGFLVGIISGAEGNLVVVGSTSYLLSLIGS